MRFSLRVCACGLGGTPAPHSLRHLLARKEGGTAGQTIFAISYQILSSTPQQLWPIGYSCSLLSYGPDTRGKNNYVYDKTLLQVPPALVPVPAPAPVQIRSSMYEYLSIPRYTRIMTRILFTHIHVPCGSHTTYD